MSRFINGNSQEILKSYPTSCVDFILTDPPYLVNFKDRSGRTIKNDKTGEWLEPIFKECYRVLKNDSFCVSFYGWNKVDQFFKAWKHAGFRVIGHLIFVKKYASNSGVVNYKHESAYVLSLIHI
jgi:adenine-specific DNA-methyltransferase